MWWSLLTLVIALCGRFYNHFHFNNRETEARGKIKLFSQSCAIRQIRVDIQILLDPTDSGSKIHVVRWFKWLHQGFLLGHKERQKETEKSSSTCRRSQVLYSLSISSDKVTKWEILHGIIAVRMSPTLYKSFLKTEAICIMRQQVGQPSSPRKLPECP